MQVEPAAEEDWRAWKARVEHSDLPLGISAGSLFGYIRDWMGFEKVCYAIMDDPGLIQDIMEHLTEFSLALIDRPTRMVKFDFAAMWEDMCFNNGSILPPKYFKEWMVPRLKRITSCLAERGCDVVFVDCDGNINELAPLWLEAGVNCMFPVEIRAGSDPVELRKQYGHRVLLIGGVDKFALIAGQDEIKDEIARIKPVVEDGGYIPHVDHRCPPDVTLENYLYYLKVKRDAFGIPEPEPWEVRKEQYEWANQ
jgi:uroporphyrinogen decarboxylase